ncbi:HAD hydrolase-like protein [Actinocatenispora sera]|uniref:HAD family hydrolase n=1 Tax=Actinocatenispora sera TaxID=390989 RepID=UPI0033E7574E
MYGACDQSRFCWVELVAADWPDAGRTVVATGCAADSDEVGYRKPDPSLIVQAARALRTAPADCWYVGDTYDRDVVCGRRAGVGATILMLAPQRRDPSVVPQPDAAVADGPELLALLRGAVRS